MRTCPQSHLQGEHVKCVVWSVEQPAFVENASLNVCSVILLAHLKRYRVHAFNRESYYLLQTSMQVGVTSVMGVLASKRGTFLVWKIAILEAQEVDILLLNPLF